MTNALRKIRNLVKETDENLLARCQQDEPGAFEKLVRRHQTRLFSVACRMMKDRDLASELVQEAFFKAFKNLQRYDGRGSAAGWLTRITVNTCLNEIRKRQKLVFSEHSFETWLEADRREGPAERAEASELRAAVRQEVEKLPPRRQAVLSLAALGYSYDEMAEALEESVSQVKSELFRARKKLREKLREERQ